MAGMIPHLDPVMEVLCTRLIQLYGDLGEPKRERCPWLRLNRRGPNDKLKVEGKLTKQGVGIGVRRTNKFYSTSIHIVHCRITWNKLSRRIGDQQIHEPIHIDVDVCHVAISAHF